MMFPLMEVSISGMVPKLKYSITWRVVVRGGGGGGGGDGELALYLPQVSKNCQLIDCTHKYFCYSCNLFHCNLIIAGLKAL